MGLAHATIQNMSTGDDAVPVKFNPSEYSVSRNINYAEIQVPGLATPLLQFVRGEAQTLSLELFLDASDRPNAGKQQANQSGPPLGIENDIAVLRALVTIDKSIHAPPVVKFVYGTQEFQGVVTNYTEKFVLFDPNGNPQRARVNLQLKAYEAPDVQLKALDKHSPDRTKTHVVREGERIDTIADDLYGDPSQWPAIARANNLSRPRILAVGTLLIIPAL
jgi:nucleoid-associated protein YgaU